MPYHGWAVMLMLFVASAVAIAIFVERLLHYHRSQINSTEFLNGVRTVLKRDNVVEALSICEATYGPVPRLLRAALLSRERGREAMRETLEEAGVIEVARLEEKLNVLATIAQIAPLVGLFGTVLGFIDLFQKVQGQGAYAYKEVLLGGVWEALVCTAFGLGLAIPCYTGYNYLVGRVNSIVLDMEKASTEILLTISNLPLPPSTPKKH